MKDTTVWSRRKYLIIVILLWCRIINQNIIGVNCNINRLHNILIRNSFPCAINSLCMCTNAGNGTHSYKISCHDVWFYKFTGELNSTGYFILEAQCRDWHDKQSIKFEIWNLNIRCFWIKVYSALNPQRNGNSSKNRLNHKKNKYWIPFQFSNIEYTEYTWNGNHATMPWIPYRCIRFFWNSV